MILRFPARMLIIVSILAILGGMPPVNRAQGQDAAARLIEQGNRDWEQGKPQEAKKHFQEAIAQDPGSLSAHLKLGGLYLSQQEFRASQKEFQRAVGLDPTNANAFVGLGIAYLHGGDYGPAYAAFSEAVRLDPTKHKDLDVVLAHIEERMAPPLLSPPKPVPQGVSPPQQAAPPTTSQVPSD